MPTYIIDCEIIFVYEDNKLISVLNSELNTTLTTPSSKCLFILLEHSPGIVRHEELLERVWGENGMIVPLNTLHQSISIIRRGFKKIQPGSDGIVKNVPGQGFKITSTIARVSDEDAVNITHISKTSKSQNHIGSSTPKIPNKFSLRVYFLIIAYSFGLILSWVLYHVYSRLNNNLFVHDDYPMIVSDEGCKFYSNARVKYDYEKQNEIQMKIKSDGFNCQEYPWEYFSSYKASSVSSAIICKQPIINPVRDNCVSFYFRDEE